MSTYAHVTVTVVLDGKTTTYDIPKVDRFETGVDYEPMKEYDTLIYGPLESSAVPRLKALTFSMRPLTTDGTSVMTVTERQGHDLRQTECP